MKKLNRSGHQRYSILYSILLVIVYIQKPSLSIVVRPISKWAYLAEEESSTEETSSNQPINNSNELSLSSSPYNNIGSVIGDNKLDFEHDHPSDGDDDDNNQIQPQNNYQTFPSEATIDTSKPFQFPFSNLWEKITSTGIKTIQTISQIFKKVLVKKGYLNEIPNSGPKSKPDKIELFDNKTTSKGLDIGLSFSNGLFESINKRVTPIYPGTVWCGMGNYAHNDASVGIFRITDNCCKKHDKCPESIRSKSEKYGLKNVGHFSRSHCDCDRDFYHCLKIANTLVSNKIGAAYFNILRPQCFRKEYPIVQCLRWFDNKCLTYLVDETKNRTWQWFDNKVF